MSLGMFNHDNLPHELLLTKRKNKIKKSVWKQYINWYKPQAQIFKIIQSGGFLGSLLCELAGSLMKASVPLAKKILAPLAITAAASAINAGIQKKIHGSGTTTLIISNEEMNVIMKID